MLSKASIYVLLASLLTCARCGKFDECLHVSDGDERLRRLAHCNRFCKYLCKLVSLLSNLDHDDLLRLTELILGRVIPKDVVNLESLVKCRECLLRVLLPNADEDDIVVLVLSSLGLREIAHLVTDPQIEDIYISEQVVFYTKCGGTINKVELSEHKRKNLARTFAKLAQLAGYELSISRPTATFTLKIGSARLRVTVDVWPVSSYITVHIRNLRVLFTLEDLIRLGTISQLDAQQVLNHVLSGGNVLIAGPPGSGKTTLLIALDLALPKNLRRVYIDEFDEFPDVDDLPQLKYRSIYGRAREIEHVLVRGGGLLIIGELRSREHFDALKLALESGLQVLATLHAGTFDELLSKLKSFLGDDIRLLEKRTLVIFMETKRAIRRVRELRLLCEQT